MGKPKLFDDEDESDGGDNGKANEELGLTVNEGYAKKYEKWRANEELQKLKDKYGEEAVAEGDYSDSSESSDEDEDPKNLLNDAEWLKTLALIKSKDSRIYDPNFSFYKKKENHDQDEGEGEGDAKVGKEGKGKKKQKPLYLRDYERKMIVEAEGKPIDEEDDEGVQNKRIVDDVVEPLVYNEEQRKLKESFKKFLNDEDGDDELLLKPKSKTENEDEEEKAAYLAWLKGKGMKEVADEDAQELDPLRRYWNDPNLPENEKFLRDFVLQGKKDDSAIFVDEEAEDLEADQSEVDKQDDFERKFNFRFEEPDPEFIKSYPRTIDDSLRKKDDRRIRKREERKARKIQEEKERREELLQMKKLKQMKIAEKLEKLRQIAGGGIDEEALSAFSAGDLEGDYDPETHAKMLERIFNDQYYDQAEDVRPDIDLDDEDLAEDIKAEAGEDWEEPAEVKEEIKDETEDPGDEDGDRPWRRKKTSKAARAIAKEKPAFDAEKRSFDEYLDEYYKLDYEDMVGGVPCRFKYRKVEPMDFGLDAKEILQAKDKELNSWVSVKRVVQYRSDNDDVRDEQKYKQKAQSGKKLKILQSLSEKSESSQKEDKEAAAGAGSSNSKNKARRAKKKAQKDDPLAVFTDDRLKAYGLQPNKFKYTKHRFVQSNDAASKKKPVFG